MMYPTCRLYLRHTSADNSLSSDDFTKFFTDKVQAVREKTADADPPTYSIASSDISLFSGVTHDDITTLLKTIPDKQCGLDPMPTWLFKKYAELFIPFL